MSTELNNKKYLDLAGLQKLRDNRFLAPHPTKTATDAGAFKVGTDAYGHVVIGDALTAADFGVDKALRFVGISTTDPTTGATVAGYTEFENGDVCIYKRTGETGYEEYIYVTGHGWELLGDADSYLLANVFNEFKEDFDAIGYSGDEYVIGSGLIKDGVSYAHKSYTAASASPVKVGRDSGGHVVFGGALSIASNGAHPHDVTVTVPADTFVVSTSDTKTHLDITPTTDKAIKTIPGVFSNLETTSITPVSGSTTASKATAGTAKNVATVDTAKRYGTANVGTEVTGLAKRAAEATIVGNANRATTGTRYGTANVGSQNFTVAGTGTAVTVATKGSEVVYGTADVGSTQTVATRAATASEFVTSVTVGAPTVTVTNGDQVFTASVDATNETLTLTPITISATASAPSVDALTDSIYGTAGTVDVTSAVAAPATQKITGVGGTTSITPAVAKTITVAVAEEAPNTQVIYEAIASTESIYGVTADQVNITPAVEAPDTQTIVPAKANGTIIPYTFADVAVPVAAAAVTVATGDLTTNGAGDAVMTGLGTITTINALTDAELVSGSTGVTVVTDTNYELNEAVTLDGTAASNGAHDHAIQ